MMRLTAYISGKVQRVGYRAKVVSLAKDMGLVGFIQNRPDSRVLVIAEGESHSLEQFASALRIKNALIDVDDVSAEYSHASGQYANFKKVTGPDEVGERLDDGIEILKELVVGVNGLVVGVNNLAIGLNNLTTITKDGFENLNGKMDQMLDKQDQSLGKMDQMLDKQDQSLGKMDQMLDKQDTSIEEIRGFRFDMKNHMDMRFKRIEADLAELKEMKAALKEKGII
jgi:acylphosphatase